MMKDVAKMLEHGQAKDPHNLVSGWMRRPVSNSVFADKPQHSKNHKTTCNVNNHCAPSEPWPGIISARRQGRYATPCDGDEKGDGQWNAEHGQRTDNGDEIPDNNDADA